MLSAPKTADKLVIYDPSGGYAAGGGWYASPVGSLLANPTLTGKVSFGFALNYFKNATYPKGETQFQFNDGGLEFNAVNFNYLAISGPKAQFKGSGKVTGDAASYNFLLTLIDGQALGGGGVDKIRMKIYNKNTNTVIYDTQPGASDAADPVTPVGSGSSMTIAGTGATGASNLANDTQLEPTSRNPKPANYILEQNHPNPFNPTTQIGYGLPVDAYVTLRVYNEIGQLVSELVNGNQSAGYKSVEFDARAVSSGIYFYKLDAVDLTNTTNVFSKVTEMLLMK